MIDGSISFAHEGGTYVLRLVGDVRQSLGDSLDVVVMMIEQDTDASSVVVDMSSVSYIDSTNLGLLARLANLSMERFDQKPILVSVNPDVNSILLSMGFDTVFRFVAVWEGVSAEFSEVPCKDHNQSTCSLLLEAHKALSDMNDENLKKFQDVVQLLESGISLS